MWLLFLPLLAGIVVLVLLALHPIRTLVIIFRIVLFFTAFAAWLAFFAMRAGSPNSLLQDLIFPALFTALWLLTFVRFTRR
jgi:hypothetical protein